MLIRRETPADAAAIHAVHTAAFAQEDTTAEIVEARLVGELRQDGDLTLSFVAEIDGEVVGHVCCSPGRIGRNSQFLGLGPLGVRPDIQKSGIGSALMHAVLGAADALGVPAVILLGSPEYYCRFGFVLAAEHGITPTEADWPPYFQVRTLHEYAADQRGEFHYAAAFGRL